MRITDRIANTKDQVANVVAFLDNEIGAPIIYLQRAGIVLDVIRSTVGAMDRLEAVAVPSDFDGSWRAYRARLQTAKQQFERIVSGSDAPSTPCRPQLQT